MAKDKINPCDMCGEDDLEIEIIGIHMGGIENEYRIECECGNFKNSYSSEEECIMEWNEEN